MPTPYDRQIMIQAHHSAFRLVEDLHMIATSHNEILSEQALKLLQQAAKLREKIKVLDACLQNQQDLKGSLKEDQRRRK